MPDDDGHAQGDAIVKIGNILVVKADATLSSSSANAFGSMSTVNTNAVEAWGLQAQEPGTIGMLDVTLAIVEIVSPSVGLLYLLE